MLPQLNLPDANLRLKAPATPNGRPQVWDVCRKQYVSLTPEEYVRQTFIGYLLNVLGYPRERTAVEASVNVNGQKHRADVVIYDIDMKPLMVVECKAPTVQISQKTLDQAFRYNTQLGVKYIVLTNGLQHYCFGVKDGNIVVLSQIPLYEKGV